MAELADGGSGPVRGGELRVLAPPVFEWSPYSAFAPPVLPLAYSQIVTLAAGDDHDAGAREIEGDLAERWETPDPATVVFTIRTGPKWPDRAPVEGRDVVASDIRAALDSFREPGRRQEYDYRGVERIEADDRARSVVLRLSEPNADQLLKMTSPLHVAVPPELAADPSLLDWSIGSRGTGPFYVSFSSRGEWSVLRNAEHWRSAGAGGGLPYLERVASGTGSGGMPLQDWDRPAVLAAWEAGTIDQFSPAAPAELEAAQLAHPRSAAQVSAPRPGGGAYFAFRREANAAFDDPRVRRALSMALARGALAGESFGGLAAPDCGLDWTFIADESPDREFREWPWDADELGPTYRHDPAEALGLLGAAGYGPDRPLALKIDAPPSDLQGGPGPPAIHDLHEAAVSGQLGAALGGTIELGKAPRIWRTFETEDGLQGRTIEPSPDADLVYRDAAGAGSSAAVDDLAYGAMHSSSERNWAGIDDPEIDRLCIAQRGEFDPLRRSEILEQLRAREAEMGWRLFLVNPYGMSVRREYVFNLSLPYFADGVLAASQQLKSTWLLPA